MSELLHWFNENSTFVTAIIVPILSGVIAFFASRYSTKVALQTEKVARSYQSVSQISAYRQQWIDDLRNDMAEHQSICLVAHFTFEKDAITEELVSSEKMYRLSELSNRILLRLNPKDPDYSKLSTALAAERARIGNKDIPKPDTILIAQRVLKREWERLKEDLRTSAIAESADP